ncbi:MAG: multicopper oxidase family protein [Candidatus Cyclobacteriaceae bacterium M3_2C_046]
MKRRRFINQSLWATGTVFGLAGIVSCQGSSKDKIISKKQVNQNFDPDLDLSLSAKPVAVNIIPGSATQVYSFRAESISGSPDAVQNIENSYLGPVIRVRKGDKIRIRFINEIDRESVIHWHGLHLPPEMDGHPRFAISPGEEFIYEFEVVDRAGTYWFHPHPDKITGPQVYQGLAGLFLVSDAEEDNLDLPSGKYDLPLIIQDRTFTNNNDLIYDQGHMTQMMGFLGDQILVNGKLSQSMQVEQATYRFRLLNGSNSRIYKLAWSNDQPVTIIGTDGGLLEQPQELPYLMLAPGERYDLWIDFSNVSGGSSFSLKSLSFNPGMMMQGMGRMGSRGMGGMMGGTTSAIPLGSEYNIMQFNIKDQKGVQKHLPSKLSSIQLLDASAAVNQDSPRTFNFFMEQMQWTINGQTFEMTEVADWEKVKLGRSEIWEFVNENAQMSMMGERGMMGQRGRGMMGQDENSGMGNMMQMPHPVHIHGLQFQIIERNTENMDQAIWDTIKDGFLDNGWQDTFLLMPDMKVKIMLEFKDFKGLYVYHCHNLEHEDMGMMRNYEIVS